MQKEDEKLAQEYLRVRTTPARIFIEVKMVEAEGVDRFATRWSLAAALPRTANAMQVGRARMIALADHRYFRVCDGCGDKHPAGMVAKQPGGDEHCRECASG